MDWVDKPQNDKDLYGILQLLRGSHLNNFPLKTLKFGWVAFHSVTFQLKCFDFQSNQYNKLVPILGVSAIGYGYLPLCQRFRKVWSEVKWKGLIRFHLTGIRDFGRNSRAKFAVPFLTTGSLP